MTVRRKPVRDLTPAEIRTFLALTMGRNRGLMHGRLEWCVRNPDGCDVFYVQKGRKIVGWGLSFRTAPYHRDLYMFTHKEYRRKGIGTAILKYVIAHKGRLKIRVHPWSKTSDAFYAPYKGILELT